MRRLRRKVQRATEKRAKRNSVRSLLSAAAAIPLIGLSSVTYGQDQPKDSTLRFQYSYYEDWQAGNEERMTVRAPMALLNTKVASNTDVELGFVLDTMSGASPIHHDTLTGASGLGIDDERTSADLTVTQQFERFDIGLGGVFSSEEDYEARGGKLSSHIWSEDKNTTFLVGANFNNDHVGSSNNDDLDELRQNFGGIVGVTQIIDKVSMVQTNVSFQTDDGYLDDPYKLADHRPASRNKLAWLTRYVRYLESLSASLHADYRLYKDSWHVNSHTFEVMLYQPLDEAEVWMLRPRLRYYTQDEAKFYSDLDPIDINDDRFYTGDQRLSGFGSLTTGMKLIRDFGDGFSANLSYDFNFTDNGLAIVSPGSPGLKDLYSSLISFGISKSF